MWRIYGDKAADMVEGLMKKPSVAVPLVLRRMRAKLDEWREAQKNYNRLWREQCDKNHAKWQQSQAASFRQVDGRQMRTKTLLNGADTAAEEVSLSHHCIVVIGCWLVNSLAPLLFWLMSRCLSVCCHDCFQIAPPPTVFLWFLRNLTCMIYVPIRKKNWNRF